MSTNVSRIVDHLKASRTGLLYGCIHVPDSPLQAFLRNEPELRRQPVAVLDGTFPLFTVVSANRFARQAGVEIGMTKLQLERFPELRIRYRFQKQEDSMHCALLDCAHYFSPRVEDTAPDTVALDLNGLSRVWGTPRALAQKLFRATDKLGIEAHIATAGNPDAAIHAAKGEAGITVIPTGQEMKRLRDLPLQILSPSEEISGTLVRWGLETFQDLTRLPKIQVSERLGQEGVHLQQLARGETSRPLLPKKETLHFRESMELEHSIDSLEPLTFILSRLLKQICQRLTARNLTTNKLDLTLSLESARDQPDHFVRTINLPIAIRDPKILLKLFQLDLDGHHPPAPIGAVALNAEPVQLRRIQNGLFLPLAPEPEKLELTLARIGSIVGGDNVGSPALLDTHRPDAFRMKRFDVTRASKQKPTRRRPINPPGAAHAPRRLGTCCVSSGNADGTSRDNAHADGSAAPSVMALRALRPPKPASVKMRQGHPSCVHFSGKSGKVVATAGPWNSSGQWWHPAPWDREEWDVEVKTGQHNTFYRIYQDKRSDGWFVDGIYD